MISIVLSIIEWAIDDGMGVGTSRFAQWAHILEQPWTANTIVFIVQWMTVVTCRHFIVVFAKTAWLQNVTFLYTLHAQRSSIAKYFIYSQVFVSIWNCFFYPNSRSMFDSSHWSENNLKKFWCFKGNKSMEIVEIRSLCCPMVYGHCYSALGKNASNCCGFDSTNSAGMLWTNWQIIEYNFSRINRKTIENALHSLYPMDNHHCYRCIYPSL